MKALVFSDSHGRLDNLLDVLKQHPDYEAIFHLGDIEGDEDRLRSLTPYPVYMVRGNCDFYSHCQDMLTVDWQGKHIVMCHGHRYLNYGGIETLRYLAEQEKADIVMFGHTHVPAIESIDGKTFVNPGSISKPRQERKIPTYIMMNSDADGNVTFELYEYARSR